MHYDYDDYDNYLSEQQKKNLEFWKGRYQESIESIDKEHSRKTKVVWICTYIKLCILSFIICTAAFNPKKLTDYFPIILLSLVSALVLTIRECFVYYSTHEYLHRDVCSNCKHIESVEAEIKKILN